MLFKLEPQSGYADSYLDIKFIVEFELSPRTEIRIFNDSIQSPIEILGSVNGFIKDETTLVCKNQSSSYGFINLFNKDKFNKNLQDFIGIAVRCEVTRFDMQGQVASQETESVVFYNQSKSLDSNILPFDLHVEDKNIYFGKPMVLYVTCDKINKYEICVKSEDGLSECFFEIVTKNGVMEINVPSEILYHDLGLNNKNKKYDLYLVKFEGIDHLKFMNRKYIKIDNTRLNFAERDDLRPTERMGPIKELPDYFVLSHRYFVHTHMNWSEFGGYAKGFDKRKITNMTTFIHESQDMNKEPDVQQFNVSSSETSNTDESKIKIRNAMWNQMRHEKTNKNILEPLSGLYTKKTVEIMSSAFPKTKIPTSITSEPKKSGCGCSRKKNG